MNPVVSTMMVMLFVLTAMGLVINMSSDVIGKAQATSHIQEEESTMKHIKDYIYQVAAEGNGSSRILSMNIKEGYFEANVPKNTIVYYLDGPGVLDYLSRKYDNGVYTISGNDVRCWKDDSYFYMENSEIRLKFIRNGTPENWVSIKNDIIKNITQKDSDKNFNITNSSLIIDDDLTSEIGNGYTELLREERNLPFCRVHLFLNSSCCSYDVYYTLFSGADFFMQEVRGPLVSKSITTIYKGIVDGGTNDIRVNGTTNRSDETIDETYNPIDKFISSQYGGIFFGVIFAGSKFNNISLKSESGYTPEFRLNQDYDKNRVIVTFTNGTWENLKDNLPEINTYGLSMTSLGTNSFNSPQKFRTSVAVILEGIELTDSTRWGTGSYELLIRNEGKIGNTTIIGLELR